MVKARATASPPRELRGLFLVVNSPERPHRFGQALQELLGGGEISVALRLLHAEPGAHLVSSRQAMSQRRLSCGGPAGI
jgi:hypothetical protein